MEDKIVQIAQLIKDAIRTRKPIDPPSLKFNFTREEAYKIQELVIGNDISGLKAGLTSIQTQKIYNTNEPVIGRLLPNSEDYEIDSTETISPKVELEIAFIFKEDIDELPKNKGELLTYIDSVTAALEIPDTRIKGRGNVEDLIADNVSAYKFTLGNTFKKPKDLDLLGGVLEINGNIVATSCSNAIMGNPINSLYWSVNKALNLGIKIRKGYVILAGSMITPIDIKKGDIVVGKIKSLGEVRVKVV
ncbi:2-keto-4-pentenoate hydratase [Saccharolobus caldissimus]|uniref:4-oxalocrotonate decarboxylase n=1 Tax=Saccharolobus caldissimus TaxID=1702097 RepID=A0AAQ4CTW7_9CREN|nr:hypothetical protein [Saccharolobus caldissimus]BDB99248.1 4-oxalocrotonate decarboxylase [Saccharolobus caldissimus]